jgi:hypothetical protein
MLNRKPDFIIGEAEHPYMSRWWIFRRKYLASIYLHRFHQSDDKRALHDHPWFNLSILLVGQYWEHTSKGRFLRKPGFIYFRHPWRAHRVELMRDDNGKEISVITMILTGPKMRNWGFHCPKGWRPWWEYVSVRPGGNAMGRGCDD